MIDNVGLIHMNGRMYDPVIGRFISPDPLGGQVGDSQSLNPYSYVNNQPLTDTDPTELVQAKTKPVNSVAPIVINFGPGLPDKSTFGGPGSIDYKGSFNVSGGGSTGRSGENGQGGPIYAGSAFLASA